MGQDNQNREEEVSDDQLLKHMQEQERENERMRKAREEHMRRAQEYTHKRNRNRLKGNLTMHLCL